MTRLVVVGLLVVGLFLVLAVASSSMAPADAVEVGGQ